MRRHNLVLSLFFLLITAPVVASAFEQPAYVVRFLDDVQNQILATPEFKDKEPFANMINTLKKNPEYEMGGTDDTKRTLFVGFQAAVEAVIAKWKQSHPHDRIVILYHTPAPITPLCTETSMISPGLIDKKVAANPQVTQNVLNRAVLVRNLLAQNIDVYTVFGKDGLSQRSSDQQKIYSTVLTQYKDHLHSGELNDKIKDDLIGATYLLTNDEGHVFSFYIRASQANAPSDKLWQLGIGPVGNEIVDARLHSVLDFLYASGQETPQRAFEAFFPTN